jgi:monofunctional biosynthetic peptidoglycan transglycosylase
MLVGLTVAAANREDGVRLIDFSRPDAVWPHINDGVMGGLSSGRMISGDGYATFEGVISFENNGGFSSVRSRPVLHDLSAYGGLTVRVRGDGKRYGFRLKTDASFDGVSYQVAIEPSAGEWTEISLPFDAFSPVYRGRSISDHPPLDSGRIMTFGLIISRQEGPFRLDISLIAATAAGQREGAGS